MELSLESTTSLANPIPKVPKSPIPYHDSYTQQSEAHIIHSHGDSAKSSQCGGAWCQQAAKCRCGICGPDGKDSESTHCDAEMEFAYKKGTYSSSLPSLLPIPLPSISQYPPNQMLLLEHEPAPPISKMDGVVGNAMMQIADAFFYTELQTQRPPPGARPSIVPPDGRHRSRERRVADVQACSPRCGLYHCAVWAADRRAAARAECRGADQGEGR